MTTTVEEDEKRRKKKLEDEAAQFGHIISQWYKLSGPGENWRGKCQNSGCKCNATIELTPMGYALGVMYDWDNEGKQCKSAPRITQEYPKNTSNNTSERQ